MRRAEDLQPGDVLLGCGRRVVSIQVQPCEPVRYPSRCGWPGGDPFTVTRGTVVATLARQERYVTGAGEIAWRELHDTMEFPYDGRLVIEGDAT